MSFILSVIQGCMVMFRSVDYPEQFSPFEWKHLQIPFLDGRHIFIAALPGGLLHFFQTFHVETLVRYTFSSKKNFS